MLHHNSNYTSHQILAVMNITVNIQLPTLFGFKIFQHTIRSPFLIPVITSHWISSYLAQFTIWFIALLFWFLDHINGFLLTSLYSKYLVLVLPRAAYLERYGLWQQPWASYKKDKSVDVKHEGGIHLPLRNKRCHPNGISCLHGIPV